MSAPAEVLVSDNLFEATVDVLWRQWRAIGGAATGQPVSRQVDPEVLCLASLFFRDHEPRLWIAMTDWIRFGAPLLSVQRFKNIAKQFPDMKDGVKALALVAWQEGKDARWKPVAGASRRSSRTRTSPKQRSAGPALSAPAALLLRLRAAFSVGVKADLFAFLMGQPFRVTVSSAAESLGYAVPTIFRALQDFRAAGMAESADLRSATEYWVNTLSWHALLGGEHGIVRWGFWREILVYICAAVTLEGRAEHRRSSEYAQATSLRALAMQHEAGLVRSGIIEREVPRAPSLLEWREFHNAVATRMTTLA
jgi:hypothetical protein